MRSSKGCPVCGRDNQGKWTCASCTEAVNVHRELIRNLQAWRSLYQDGEVSDILIAANGQEYCLWDVQRLYDHRIRLAPRQALAIELCLWENVAEREAAVRMGVSSKSPVAIYATVGLSRLLGMAFRDEIPGYRLEDAS